MLARTTVIQQDVWSIDPVVADFERDFGGFIQDTDFGLPATLVYDAYDLLSGNFGSEKSESIVLWPALAALGSWDIDIASFIHPPFEGIKTFSLTHEPSHCYIDKLINNDLKVAASLYETVTSLHDELQESLIQFVSVFLSDIPEVTEIKPDIVEIILLRVSSLLKRLVAIIARLRFLHFVQYMFGRRFRNGRRSRRLLLHHAYQTCSSSIVMFLNEHCLINQLVSRGMLL